MYKIFTNFVIPSVISSTMLTLLCICNLDAQLHNSSIVRSDLNADVTTTLSNLEQQINNPRMQAEAVGTLFNGTPYFAGEVYLRLKDGSENPGEKFKKALVDTLRLFKEQNNNPVKYTDAASLYAAFPRTDITVPNQTSFTMAYNTSKDPETLLALSGAYRSYPAEKLSLFIIGISGLQPKDLQLASNLDPVFNAVNAYYTASDSILLRRGLIYAINDEKENPFKYHTEP